MPRELGRLEAAEALASLDPYVWHDIATSLTCSEAEALADFLSAWQGKDAADSFLESHACGDDEGDMHATVTDDDGTVITWRYNEDDEDDTEGEG